MHVRELFDLSGQTAIVTGGGRGLGKQIATALAECGANIVLCSRNVAACKEVSEKLQEFGVRTLALSCDVGDPEEVNGVVHEALSQFGSIDILFNNSGTSWGAPATDMPLDKWEKVFRVNARGTFLMSQAVGREMIKQKRGVIINIASVAGLTGSYPEVLDAVGYNASKGAIITLTKDLAVKWARYGIRVNAIAPGFFPTKMAKAVMEKNRDRILLGTPLGRFGGDDDLKGAAVFLASRASAYVTGHVLTVDGGQTAM